MADASIAIAGAWAELYGLPVACLDACLSFPDPKRFFNPAWRDRRWDGKVRLYSGRSFPAGLVQHVLNYLKQAGYDVTVTGGIQEPVEAPEFDAKYLPGITLYDYQVDAVRKMLVHANGIMKMITASGKTEVFLAAARLFWDRRGWRTLIVVPRKGLATQTVERANRYYQGDLTVGQCGDGVKTEGRVVVATAQTLIGFQGRMRKGQTIPADPMLLDIVKNFEVLVLDEAHHTSSASWYSISMASGAFRRYGFSGTPLKDQEVADMKLIGATGPIICETGATEVIELELVAKPKIAMVMADNASGPAIEVAPRPIEEAGSAYAEIYEQGVILNEHHNRAVLRAAAWLVEQGRATLILCRRKAHWLLLKEMLEEGGFEFQAVWGATETEERLEAKRLLREGHINVILGSIVYDEGVDIPNIGGMVLAEGVKSMVNALQRIGRGMRRKPGANDVWVVDFVPVCHLKLRDHANERARAYLAEGYEVKLVESWPDKDDVEFDSTRLLPFHVWDEVEISTMPEKMTEESETRGYNG